MKKVLTAIIIGLLAGLVAGVFTTRKAARWTVDNQVASGEWRIELHTPPCESEGDNPTHNLQVLFPARSGEPATIECDLMPVAEK